MKKCKKNARQNAKLGLHLEKNAKMNLHFQKNAPDDFGKKIDHLANILQFEKMQESKRRKDTQNTAKTVARFSFCPWH